MTERNQKNLKKINHWYYKCQLRERLGEAKSCGGTGIGSSIKCEVTDVVPGKQMG